MATCRVKPAVCITAVLCSLFVEKQGVPNLLALRFFRGRVIPVTSKLALHWLPCQSPGVKGSVLGLVGPVSIYCDWVRWKAWSAASISVWQHVKLSEQIRLWDTLSCCQDVKQPTNKQKNPIYSAIKLTLTSILLLFTTKVLWFSQKHLKIFKASETAVVKTDIELSHHYQFVFNARPLNAPYLKALGSELVISVSLYHH